MHTAESEFSNFTLYHLGEIETELEKTFACLSGTWMGSNLEKIDVENLMTPFKGGRQEMLQINSRMKWL